MLRGSFRRKKTGGTKRKLKKKENSRNEREDWQANQREGGSYREKKLARKEGLETLERSLPGIWILRVGVLFSLFIFFPTDFWVLSSCMGMDSEGHWLFVRI